MIMPPTNESLLADSPCPERVFTAQSLERKQK